MIMRFESIANSYRVVDLESGSPAFDTYLCKKDDSTGSYYITLIKDEKLRPFCCSYFLGLLEEGKFDSICEIFSDADTPAFVFRGCTISDSISRFLDDDNEISFEEKIHFLYDVISGLCIHEVPVPIACDLLINDNCGISDVGSADLRLVLREFEDYESFDMKKLSEILAKKLRIIFKYELRDKLFSDLSRFVDRLTKAPPEDIKALFARYDDIFRLYVKKIEDGSLLGGKSTLKKVVSWLLKILKIVIVAGALAGAVWLLSKSLKSSSDGGSYDKIGTVKVEEYDSSE